MEAQVARGRIADGLEPFEPHRTAAAVAQVVAHGEAQRVVAVEVPAAREFGAADVVGDVGVVVLRGLFRHALPDAPGDGEAVAQLGAAHQVDAVPAARQRQALAVRLVHHAHARIAPAPAAGQGEVQRIDIHQLGLVVGGAERPRDRAVEQLPGRLLRIREPQRVLLGRLVLREQALGDLGAHRQADAHLVGLVGHGRAGMALRGRGGRVGPAGGGRGRHVERAVAAEAEGAAVGAVLQFPEARQRRVLTVAAAFAGADRDHARGRYRGVHRRRRLRAGQHRRRHGHRDRRQRLLLRPAVEAGQARFVAVAERGALLPRQLRVGQRAARLVRGLRMRGGGAAKAGREGRQPGDGEDGVCSLGHWFPCILPFCSARTDACFRPRRCATCP